MAVYQAYNTRYPAPKKPKSPKVQPKAVNPAQQIKPGQTQAQIQAQLAGQKAPKTVARWGPGTEWTSTEFSPEWGSTLAWLLNGNTAQNFATQIKVIKGVTYVGNDHDGYTSLNQKMAKAGTPGGPAIEGPPRPGHAPKAGQPGGPPIYGPANPKQGQFGYSHQPGVAPNADQIISAFDGLAHNNSGRFGEVQSLLFQAGYYGSASPILGSYSGSDQQAFIYALTDARNAGVPVQDFLADRAAKATAQGLNAGPRRAPEVIQYTNPLDIKGAVGPEATQVLGRGLTDAQMQQYIDSVHAGEKTAADASYKAHGTVYNPQTGQTDAGPGGSYVAAPSLNQGTIDATLKATQPDQYAAGQMGERGAQLLQIMQRGMPGGTMSGQV